MIGNQEEDEFVAVRVQDPRVQNEGSWNSFVDYKIFLHTNSKAFTAKTSCVRRRYSEFSWLKKRLQKNTGLVPVPELPSKSFFSFSNEDFLEGRRKGLQVFLDKVVKMTVCLSDSQLHLFLQTQLPVGHILDCVQGHTPYSVTDAILTYASSNRGFAQAQEEESAKEPSLTVSYESMESPAPHQPCLQTKETDSPELLPCDDPVTEEIWDHDDDTVESNHEDKSTVTVHQKKNHLEAVVKAVVEVCGPAETSFFLGDNPNDKPGSLSCLIQTPVEVHSPMGAGFEEESFLALDTEEQTVVYLDTEDNEETLMEASGDYFEPEKCVTAVDILDFKDSDTGSQEDPQVENQVLENVLATEEQTVNQIAMEEKNEEESSGEASMENVEPETCATSVSNSDFKDNGVLGDDAHAENHVISEVNGLEQIGQSEGHVEDVGRPEELRNSEGLKESENEKFDKSESKEDTPVESEIHEEEKANDVTILQMTQELVEQGTEDLVEAISCPIEFKNFAEQIEGELDNEKSDKLESKEETTLVGSESHEEEVYDVTVESMTQELVKQEVDLVEGVASPKEFTDFDGQEKDLDNEKCDESKSKVATPVESEIHEEEEVEECNDIVEQMNQEQVEQEVDLVEDVASPEEFTDLDTQKKDLDIDSEKCDESENKNETATESEIHEEEVEECNDVVEQINQERVEREVGLIGTKDESGDEDRQSLHSSNESIVKVSDEESLADETEDLNGYVKTSPDQLEASSINILDLHINGCPGEKEGISTQEEEDIRYITDIADLDNSLELNTAVTAADLTENSDFSILEVSCTP